MEFYASGHARFIACPDAPLSTGTSPTEFWRSFERWEHFRWKNKDTHSVQNRQPCVSFSKRGNCSNFAKPWDIQLKPVLLQSYNITEANKGKSCTWLAWLGHEMSLKKKQFFKIFHELACYLKRTCWPSQASAGAAFALISFSSAVALQRDRFELNSSRFRKVRAIPALGKSHTRLAVLDTVCDFIFSLKMLYIFETFSKFRGTGTSRTRSIRWSDKAPRLDASPEFYLWNNSRKMRRFSTFANSDHLLINIQPRQSELRAWLACQTNGTDKTKQYTKNQLNTITFGDGPARRIYHGFWQLLRKWPK